MEDRVKLVESDYSAAIFNGRSIARHQRDHHGQPEVASVIEGLCKMLERQGTQITRLTEQNRVLREALGAWDQWEDDLLVDSVPWGVSSGFHASGRHFDRYVELQEMRSQALAAQEMRMDDIEADKDGRILSGPGSCPTDEAVPSSPSASIPCAWQPIETAPKDEIALAVIEPTEKNRVHAYRPAVHPVYFDEEGRVCDAGTCRPDVGIQQGYFRATHWMPLPPPPQGEP